MQKENKRFKYYPLHYYSMETENNNEIYELTCEVCGKIIKSLSENQANFNMKQHKLIHEKDGN